MVNTEAFIQRLEKILDYYQLTASAFADRINVQRSSISHLLTGRNKPSLEFVLKVVKSFPEVNLYWLLNGKGRFPQEKQVAALPKEEKAIPSNTSVDSVKEIEKIIFFYTDGSFRIYKDKSDKPSH
ncbi:helix-turn-helix domain-containing protein [Eudoraea sp.]|uniref:helix-turn-helix domain-containing protein n=1 Tax=Eudoraea sp. TaxID=1979955 RepID=UPI003C7385A7